MQGFNTARVLVVDDEPNEAMPVIHALGLLGMGAIYHNGDASTTGQKLAGIRVMFVDMVLSEHGADATDHAGCAKMVVEVLAKLVEHSNDPMVVVCWTAHKEIKDVFERVLRDAFSKNRIGEVYLANKPDKSDWSNPDVLKKLRELIQSAIDSHSPINMLFNWEQAVHNAATRTTNAITELVYEFHKSDSLDWNECAYRVCAALALSERGSRLIAENEAFTLKAIYDALNPILIDRLEHRPVGLDEKIKGIAKECLDKASLEYNQRDKGKQYREAVKKREDLTKAISEHFSSEIGQGKLDSLPRPKPETDSLLSSKLRASLNSMMLLSQSGLETEVAPGNIYLSVRNTENRKSLDSCQLDWQAAKDDTYSLNGTLPQNHFIALVEFSPSCDFAQDKTKMPRFVLGFLIPEADMHMTKHHFGYVRTLGPILLTEAAPGPNGIYYLILNAHFVIGISKKIASNLKPLARLRSNPLTDVTSWLSYQMSRPGYLHLEP